MSTPLKARPADTVKPTQEMGSTYFGISGATLPQARLPLGHGLILSQTYAHLTAPYIMAFAPAKPGAPHPGPWRAANGGFGYDVTIQLEVPHGSLPAGLTAAKAGWWVLALLRIAHAPYLFAPVTIDTPLRPSSARRQGTRDNTPGGRNSAFAPSG